MARTRSRKRRPNDARQPPAATRTNGSQQRYIVAGSRVDGPADWRWKTFPVFFVFAVTLFLASALCTFFASRGWYLMTALLTLLAAIPLAMALAHLVTLRYIAQRAPHPHAEED